MASSTSTTSGPVKPNASSTNNIIVSSTQRLNPVLEHVRNVGKEFGEIVADYQVGRTTGVLYLSLKYHRLHPEYVHQRIERLGPAYNLRILLILCDISEHQEHIRELTKMCLINNITILVAWSVEEVGHYLGTFKQFEHRPPDMIKERVDKDYGSVLRSALTSISKVNKTDVETLRTSFGSFSKIATAPTERLSNLPGFGQVKVRRIRDAFDKPFRTAATSTLTAVDKVALSEPAEPLDDDEISTWAASELTTGSTVNKGKAKETSVSSPRRPAPRPARDDTPPWDTDNMPSPLSNYAPSPMAPVEPRSSAFTQPAAQQMPQAGTSTAGAKRHPSPVWDIELDLNLSEDEPDGEHGQPARKRPRNQEEGR